MPSGNSAGPRQAPPIDRTVWNVPINDDDAAKGPKTALVTIAEFSDFQ